MKCESKAKPHQPMGPEAAPRSEPLLGPDHALDTPPFAPDADTDVIAAARTFCAAASNALRACLARAARLLSARPATPPGDAQ